MAEALEEPRQDRSAPHLMVVVASPQRCTRASPPVRLPASVRRSNSDGNNFYAYPIPFYYMFVCVDTLPLPLLGAHHRASRCMPSLRAIPTRLPVRRASPRLAGAP